MTSEERVRTVDGDETPAIRTVMRAKDVVDAYARWAPIYDAVFGQVMEGARRSAVAALPPGAERVLEVGVGTGISLPDYPAGTRVVGIDLSPDMLERARRRVAEGHLKHVEALHEMDAARLAFPNPPSTSRWRCM